MAAGVDSGRLFVAYFIIFAALRSSGHVHVSGKGTKDGKLGDAMSRSQTDRTTSSTSLSPDEYIQLDELSKLAIDGSSLAADLRRFIDVQQKRIDRLQRLAEAMDRDSISAVADPSNYLGNAVNSFRLARRLAVDWHQAINEDVRNNDRKEFLTATRRTTNRLPKPPQLSRLAKALFRLQDTYNLTSDAIARGELLPVPRHLTTRDKASCDGGGGNKNGDSCDHRYAMNADDSFELGRIAYVQADYYHAVTWFEYARHVLMNDDKVATSTTFNRTALLDYLAYSLYQGDVRGALKWTKALLKLDPQNTRYNENKSQYTKILATSKKTMSKFVNERKLDAFRQTNEYRDYERLCRGEDTQQVHRRIMSCRHVNNHPSLFLSPAREEQVLEDPPITIYHDVVTEAASERIKQLAQAKFRTSKVVPHANFDIDKYDARSSKTAWISDGDDIMVAGLSRRVSILSNLDKETAEEFQVLSYGIGGHYVPHNDFFDPKLVKPIVGNRIATVLCYLSSVTAGGATVFPQLGISVPPQEGSCVMWYNLLTNGEGDLRSRHASCPVLVGFKWAFNKWFRERGQEFKRPCLSGDAI